MLSIQGPSFIGLFINKEPYKEFTTHRNTYLCADHTWYASLSLSLSVCLSLSHTHSLSFLPTLPPPPSSLSQKFKLH
jgi:hypothetical protein